MYVQLKKKKNPKLNLIAKHIIHIHTLTVKFFQRPVRAVWMILEIPFFTSGKSDNLGGVNSTLAYLTQVCRLGLTMLIMAK